METTIWALVPPMLAIIVSLITKKVNLSLFIGLLSGVLIYTNFNIFESIITMFTIMGDKANANIGVLIFIILLGMIVYLMGLSGATNKYGEWASEKLKSRKSSLFATMFLGILIFIDDYFNCLTVGTVMSPITDKHKISREKLAYIIDCTSAPICIIAPISSWAAAVSTSLPTGSKIDGFGLFIKTIFCNYYSLLTLLLVFLTILLSVDFGKMKKYENEVLNKKDSDIKTITIKKDDKAKGKVIDLILPIASLIILSIVSMLYTGGFFKGVSISDAFANCDAITGLAIGGLLTVVFVALLYLPRKVVTFDQFNDGLVEGFKAMVPATLILILAWSLSGICSGDYLNAGGYIAGIVNNYSISLNLMPAIFFVVALVLAFSTGTSWGTFAILLPIVVATFNDSVTSLMVLSSAAVLGGSVCGDHISPISDTTILSSTGAGCNHIRHVESQLQYGLLVALVSFISYLLAGFTSSIFGLLFGIASLVAFSLLLKYKASKAS